MNWKAKKFYLPLCAATFTTIAVNGGALADSISLGPESFLTNSIDSSMFGSNEFSDTLTFDLFDGNLGTLTGVSMEIDYLHDSFLDVGRFDMAPKSDPRTRAPQRPYNGRAPIARFSKFYLHH